MDSFETNKILGAVLFTLLALQALNIAAGAAFSPRPPTKPGYEIAVAPPKGEAEKAAAPAAEEPIEQALAKADPKHGEQDAKICLTCHTLGKGEPNKIGPNLWDVVGRPKGSDGLGWRTWPPVRWPAPRPKRGAAIRRPETGTGTVPTGGGWAPPGAGRTLPRPTSAGFWASS